MSMESILPLAIAFERYRQHYDKGGADYSVTEIIQPVRITHLQKRHWPEILKRPLNVKSLLDSFDGTSTHMLFEKMLRDDPTFNCEQRVYMEILGRRVSGCPDLIHKPTRTLYDYKRCKVWKKLFNDVEHWEQQLNIYAWLIEVNYGFSIRKIEVVAWFKDWDEHRKEESGDGRYPEAPVELMGIPLWTPERQAQFFIGRVTAVVNTEYVPDNELPECTPQEMWERGGGWAAMPYLGKRRGFKAGRVLPTRPQIEEWIENNPPSGGRKWKIEERVGSRQRCENYCDVRDWCNQYQKFIGGK